MKKNLIGYSRELFPRQKIKRIFNVHGGNTSYGKTMHREADTWLREHGREIGIVRTSCSTFESNAYRLWDDSHQNSHPAAHEEVTARLCAVCREQQINSIRGDET